MSNHDELPYNRVPKSCKVLLWHQKSALHLLARQLRSGALIPNIQQGQCRPGVYYNLVVAIGWSMMKCMQLATPVQTAPRVRVSGPLNRGVRSRIF